MTKTEVATHTPGPWIGVIQNFASNFDAGQWVKRLFERSNAKNVYFIINNTETKTICLLGETNEGEANARLIAESPMLKLSLMESTEMLRAILMRISNKEEIAEIDDLISRNDAAIAKAEGK